MPLSTVSHVVAPQCCEADTGECFRRFPNRGSNADCIAGVASTETSLTRFTYGEHSRASTPHVDRSPSILPRLLCTCSALCFHAMLLSGDTVEYCGARGLVLCSKTCRNTGCLYNNNPVFSSLPCAPARVRRAFFFTRKFVGPGPRASG